MAPRRNLSKAKKPAQTKSKTSTDPNIKGRTSISVRKDLDIKVAEGILSLRKVGWNGRLSRTGVIELLLEGTDIERLIEIALEQGLVNEEAVRKWKESNKKSDDFVQESGMSDLVKKPKGSRK